jgi:hypothetical protein
VAIFKYAKVLVLAPAIGSALIGIAGLVFGVVLIVGRDHSADQIAGLKAASIPAIPRSLRPLSALGSTQKANVAKSPIQPEAAVQHSTDGRLLRTHPVENQTTNRHEKQTEARLDFGRSIEGSALTFLKDYAGRAVDDVDGKRHVKTLVSMVAPYTPYHFGADFPLPQVLDVVMLTVPEPIEIREGRYAMISGSRGPNHRGRGFLWVDMREGFALGGIFFDPSDGEPSPTLTIFSKQMDRRSVRISQLPRAFTQDLSRWSATAGIPQITTRYFIGTSGEKFVLTHDENYCVRSADVNAPAPKGECEKMNAQAALIDMTAARFMVQTHNASNATVRMIASTGQVE